jgi:hypothetical protein
LLDDVTWWRTDDLWFWALEALVTSVRAAASLIVFSPARYRYPGQVAR